MVLEAFIYLFIFGRRYHPKATWEDIFLSIDHFYWVTSCLTVMTTLTHRSATLGYQEGAN